MLPEFFTALVISYNLPRQDQDTATYVWFESEKHCQEAMRQDGSAEPLYDYIMDLYGNNIMMTCERSNLKSKEALRPKLRPERR